MDKSPQLHKKDYFDIGSFPVKVIQRAPQLPFPIHHHNFSEMVIILSGEGEHITETSNYSLKRGDLFIVNGDSSHGFANLKNLHLINILFDLDGMGFPLLDLWETTAFQYLFNIAPSLRGYTDDIPHLNLSNTELENLLLIVNKLNGAGNTKDKPVEFHKMTLFIGIINNLIEVFNERSFEVENPYIRFGYVFAYIEQNLHKNPSIKELCELAHMSESTLQRSFKKVTGKSPKNYYNARKIIKSAQLLRFDKEKSITDIANSVGFDDMNYFSRQFKKYMFQSPSKYRKL